MDELKALRKVDFNWVVHPDLIWDDNVPDAPGLHGDICDELLEAARDLRSPQPALGRMLLGPAGSGKTHLLAMLRKRAVRDGITFVMTDLTDVRDFFDTLLLGFLVSLQQPDASGQPQFRAILASMIDMLSTRVSGSEYVRGLAACKPDALAKPIADILGGLQRDYRDRMARHSDVVRAVVLLNADNYEVNSIGQTWLQGMEIEEEPKRLFGFSTSRQKPSEIVQGLSWLASLRGPTIVAIDQLDPIVAHNRLVAQAQALKEQDESTLTAKAILNDLCNGLGSLHTTTVRTLRVVTCLETSFETLKEYGLRANLDRFEPPESLSVLNEAETAEEIVRVRLDRAYRATGFEPPHPTWPFAPSFFAEAAGQLPRMLLKRCHEHRNHCKQQGVITELQAFVEKKDPTPPSPPPPPQGDLDRRFKELCEQAEVQQLLDERREDELLSGLLVTAAECLVKEAPPSHTHDAVVDSEFPGGRSFMPLHARIRLIELETGAEKHYCMRALEKTHAVAYQARLRAAMTSAGIDRKLDFRQLVIFRVNAVPSGKVTAQRTQDFLNKGGIMVKPEEHEIATLWALQQLAAEGHDTFEAWLREKQLVHSLPMMQEAKLVKAPDNGSVGKPSPPPQSPQHTDESSEARKQKPAATKLPPKTLASTAQAGVEETLSHGQLPVGARLIGGDRRGDTVTIPLLELRKHVTVFAGAGSGKTVLVKRLIEEAALCGVPAIVVDTANDLAQLGDPWPEPPAKWEPGDPAKAKRFFQTTETIFWTPGLEGGNPLRLEPLPDLAAVAGDVDELNDALAMAREALQDIVAPGSSETARNRLGILTAALKFFASQGGGSLEDFVALLGDLPADADGGISGAPKQASKMADALRSQMQMDPLLGQSGKALDPAVLLGLDENNGKTRISVLNFAGLRTLEQQQQFLNRLAMTLFSWIKSHPADSATPLRGILVVDEARDFIPGTKSSACRDSFVRLAAQARKYGLGLIFATQAPKDIYNGIVSNCATSFYGTGNSPAVINAIKELLQNKGGRGDDIARLGTGRFYIHNADVTEIPIKISTSLCLSHHRDPLTPEIVAERARASRARMP